MTYKRKKRDVASSPVTAADLKILKRIYSKYGAASFETACWKIKTMPARGPGRDKRYIGNLASVLIAVDEVANEKAASSARLTFWAAECPAFLGNAIHALD